MKNLKTFEQFVNESFNKEKTFEKKELSPANIKAHDANKNSVAKLKNWSYKLKDITAKFRDMEYYGADSDFFNFLGNNFNLNYLFLDIGDTNMRITISAKHEKLSVEYNASSNSIWFNIKQSHFFQYISGNEDKVLGFIDLLDFLFKNFESEIYGFASGKMNQETLYVIKAGEIAPATGKTGHGWSIYDYSDGILGAAKNGIMLLNAKGMKVGDKFKILDDQTQKVLFNEVEIVALIPTTYQDFVEYSRRDGREIPVGRFNKQTGRGRYTLYSIK
jgi:hypothetical protein